MERRTHLLELIAMLTLLATTDGGNTELDVQDFVCRWEKFKDRLVCGFGQLGTETLWTNNQYNLTLDDSETVRCQQNRTEIECIYEDLKLEKFGNSDSHKFQLRLVTFKEVEIKEFNLTLAEMDVPENNVACVRPQRPPKPLLNGFYHDPEKKELYIYWQPLDEWEFGSKRLWYAVNASSGLIPTFVGIDFALFSGWNPEQPVNMTIWSENSVGRSRDSSHLNVPILTNANQRQPLNVLYHDNRRIVEWNHTTERAGLDGYLIYTCLKSKTSSSICDINDRMYPDKVNANRNIFQFNSSMTLQHMGVAAIYKNGISGGLVWSKPASPPRTLGIMDHLVIVGSIMIIFIALYALSMTIYKKLLHMADIKVELPFLGVPIFESGKHNLDPFPGHISPRAMGMNMNKSDGGPLVPSEKVYIVTFSNNNNNNNNLNNNNNNNFSNNYNNNNSPNVIGYTAMTGIINNNNNYSNNHNNYNNINSPNVIGYTAMTGIKCFKKILNPF